MNEPHVQKSTHNCVSVLFFSCRTRVRIVSLCLLCTLLPTARGRCHRTPRCYRTGGEYKGINDTGIMILSFLTMDTPFRKLGRALPKNMDRLWKMAFQKSKSGLSLVSNKYKLVVKPDRDRFPKSKKKKSRTSYSTLLSLCIPEDPASTEEFIASARQSTRNNGQRRG